ARTRSAHRVPFALTRCTVLATRQLPVSARGTSGNRSGEQSCLEVQLYCPGAPKHTNVPFALTGCIVLWDKKDLGEREGDARARRLCLAAVGRGWQRFAVLIDA